MTWFDPYAALAKLDLDELPPATSATSATQTPENPVHVAKVASVAGAGALNSTKREAGGLSVSDQLDQFREKAATLEAGDSVPRDWAVWLAALSAFVLPHERVEYFDGDGSLLPLYRHVCLAIGDNTVVTFHSAGRVSFNRGDSA